MRILKVNTFIFKVDHICSFDITDKKISIYYLGVDICTYSGVLWDGCTHSGILWKTFTLIDESNVNDISIYQTGLESEEFKKLADFLRKNIKKSETIEIGN